MKTLRNGFTARKNHTFADRLLRHLAVGLFACLVCVAFGMVWERALFFALVSSVISAAADRSYYRVSGGKKDGFADADEVLDRAMQKGTWGI